MIPSLESLDWHGFLDREPLPRVPDEALAGLRRKPILITGAGGSIGSAVALRLAEVGTELILLEASEPGLYDLHCALTRFSDRGKQVCYLGSAGDRGILEEIFELHRPHVVFHTAAFKHVPLLEEQPLAAIANNILGTQAVADAAGEHGAGVVLLSTDKVVAPRSVMGATKRVAEQIVAAANGVVVRLANVLGSRGSVSEVFARQIAARQRLTVTDAAATRYFLTLAEAVDLLLAAPSALGRASILVPLLRRDHRISDLAQFMTRVLTQDREAAIEFTGLRAGEKISEKLWADEEAAIEDVARGLVRIQPEVQEQGLLRERLRVLAGRVEARDLSGAFCSLRELVPDYEPSAAVLSRVRDSAVLSE